MCGDARGIHLFTGDGVRDSIGEGSFQSTGRKPGDMLPQRFRRLAPAALTRRTQSAETVTDPWRRRITLGWRAISGFCRPVAGRFDTQSRSRCP